MQSAHQQISRTPLLLSIDGTDGRTPDRYRDPAPRTTQAASIERYAWRIFDRNRLLARLVAVKAATCARIVVIWTRRWRTIAGICVCAKRVGWPATTTRRRKDRHYISVVVVVSV